ncbi:peptidoglycan DD-metalloendopeptidase family protein [Metabacillus herbersteinensis]|uniref:Peptidoglycan DD-metalloendopeptidase family protein n=1 Tax=Metabacillus herbersteinensis TaxID=283816 RepID=A0ABV6GK03_9BACI
MGLRKTPEEKQENPLARIAKDKLKQQASKKGKKVAKKLAKKGAKVAAKALKSAGVALAKTLLSLLGAVGLPLIVIVVGIIFLVIITSLVTSFMFGTGDGLEGSERNLHNYIVEQADKTVDMNSSIQRPYRVPHELIAVVIQLDAMTREDEKKVINEMSDTLSPTFIEGRYNEWTEKKTQVCEDGNCKPWSDVNRTDKWVTKLDDVDFWNGHTTFIHDPYTTEWETNTKITYRTDTWTETETYQEKVIEDYIEYVEVARYEFVDVPYTEMEYTYIEKSPGIYIWIQRPVTKYRKEKVLVIDVVPIERSEQNIITKTREVEKSKVVEIKTITKTRHQKFNTTESRTEDYANFDQMLNTYGLGMNDKRLIELNYMFSNGTIAYTDWLSGNANSGFGTDFGGFNGTIIPGNGVPAQYLEMYLAAEKKYGVDWYTLAAVHFVETGFSTHATMVSGVGAQSHMQFMPATWVGWKYNIGGGLVSSSLDITSLGVIKSGNGYGVDGDGDGKADPWNLSDAISTAAHYLSKNKYATDPRGAVFQYNHANWYVEKVMKNAQKFKTEAVYKPADGEMPTITDGDFMRPAAGPISSGYGPRWGKLHAGVDIAKKGTVPIVSVADGVVVRSYMSSSYGNCVIIRHNIRGKQFESLYAHMTHRAVRDGQQVSKGQFLGNMGNTGRSTGQHLHFGLYSPNWQQHANSLDPLLYIPLK